MNLDFADAEVVAGVIGRKDVGAVPTVAQGPFGAGRGVRQRGGGGGHERGGGAAGEGNERGVIEHVVVDADFVDVATTREVVVTLDLIRANDAGVRSELVEGGVVDGGGFVFGGELAIDVKAETASFVPGNSEVRPSVGRGKGVEFYGDASAREAGIGDEGVETVAVVIDAEPNHVPAGVIGVGDAEDGKLRGPDGFARAPEKRERAAGGIDVAGGAVSEALEIGAAEGGAMRAVGDGRDFGVKSRSGRARRGEIGRGALFGGEIKKESVASWRRRSRGRGDGGKI